MASAATTRRVKVTSPDPEKEEVPQEAVEEDAELEVNTVEDEVELELEEELERDDAEEMWSGGPTFGDLKAWKKEFGENNIYISMIRPEFNEYCVWRTLKRDEYRAMVRKLENSIAEGQISETEATMNNEEDITELCAIFPPYDRRDRKNTNAGLPKMISTDVLEMSGFVQVEVRKL